MFIASPQKSQTMNFLWIHNHVDSIYIVESWESRMNAGPRKCDLSSHKENGGDEHTK